MHNHSLKFKWEWTSTRRTRIVPQYCVKLYSADGILWLHFVIIHLETDSTVPHFSFFLLSSPGKPFINNSDRRALRGDGRKDAFCPPKSTEGEGLWWSGVGTRTRMGRMSLDSVSKLPPYPLMLPRNTRKTCEGAYCWNYPRLIINTALFTSFLVLFIPPKWHIHLVYHLSPSDGKWPTTPLFCGSQNLWVVHWNLCTACGHRMAHRKWKETKQQPGTAGPGNILGSCLVSFHFLCCGPFYVRRLYNM